MATRTRDWESIFETWAQPPSQAEQDRCENATRAIREAIAASAKLKRQDVKVFVHGSYRNNVNVRRQSDIDVGVLCTDVFFSDLPAGKTDADFGIYSASYTYGQFKDEVGEALVSFFGQVAVTRGNKAFDLRANSYRVEADVAPFFHHRRYNISGNYLVGVELRPDSGGRIINWPEQHYANGVTKNDATSRAFKGIVRILKRLGVEMEEGRIAAARTFPGFLIECMTYNAPNGNFNQQTWKRAVREVLAFLFNNTLDDDRSSKWTEVSELKWLFRSTQKWARHEAHAFLDAAWNYLGLE